MAKTFGGPLSTSTKLIADGVFPGAAGNMPIIHEAYKASCEYVHYRRVGGTSAGGMIALLDAFGVPASEQTDLIDRLLQKNRLLDTSLMPLSQGGLCKWQVIGRETKKLLGDKRLGQALKPVFVVVCDAYTRRPVVVSSWANPLVKVHEVASATSAIWPLAQMQQIPSLGFGNRLFYDGGFAMNFAMDVYDDDPQFPTLGIRIQPDLPRVIPTRTNTQKAVAVAETLMWASNNAFLSQKNCSRVITIPTHFDGFNFNQTKHELMARRTAGSYAAHAFDYSQDLVCLV